MPKVEVLQGWLELLLPSGVDEPPVQSSSRGEL
jgi:hypothetical protein